MEGYNQGKNGISSGDLSQDMEDFRILLFEAAEILKREWRSELANSILLRGGFLIGTIHKNLHQEEKCLATSTLT